MNKANIIREIWGSCHHFMNVLITNSDGLDLGDRIFTTKELCEGLVLKLSDTSTKNLKVDYDKITCDISFNNKIRRCCIPLDCIMIIENNDMVIHFKKSMTEHINKINVAAEHTKATKHHLKIIK